MKIWVNSEGLNVLFYELTDFMCLYFLRPADCTCWHPYSDLHLHLPSLSFTFTRHDAVDRRPAITNSSAHCLLRSVPFLLFSPTIVRAFILCLLYSFFFQSLLHFEVKVTACQTESFKFERRHFTQTKDLKNLEVVW